MIAQSDLNAADVLECAAGFLDRGWCQGALARDANGLPLNSTSPDAVGWCASGAIVKASFELFPYGGVTQHRAATDATAFLLRYVANIARAGDPMSVAEWNDAHGREAWEVGDAMRQTCQRIRAGVGVPPRVRGNLTIDDANGDGDGGGYPPPLPRMPGRN